jgi:hypothetical protein
MMISSGDCARDDTELHATIAGFIVWLAGHAMSPEQRHSYPEIVERFLRWQNRRRDQHTSIDTDHYYTHLAQTGATQETVGKVRTAIELLRRYLQEND